MSADLVTLFEIPVEHDPGGTSLQIPVGVNASAVYGGPSDCYRYLLTWVWDSNLPRLAVGMMNPSTASHLVSDRTIAWVHRWATRNGFGSFSVFNAAAYRATDQSRLAEIADPRGPLNDQYMLAAARTADMIVLGYGVPKVRSARDHGPRMTRVLLESGYKLHAWQLSKDGIPKHPLYLKGDVQAVAYKEPPQ